MWTKGRIRMGVFMYTRQDVWRYLDTWRKERDVEDKMEKPLIRDDVD